MQQKRARRIEGRVAIACNQCRNQHLRCDAIVPTCSRCRNLRKTCVYTDLRRSRRRRNSVEKPTPSGHRRDIINASRDSPALILQSPAFDAAPSPVTPFVACTHALPPAVLVDSHLLTSRPVDAFYKFFFPGHPFVLPREHLMSQSERTAGVSYGLALIIAFIGSKYMHDSLSGEYRQGAERALSEQLVPNGFNVQALMLLALALEWSGESERAAAILEQAKTLGLEAGMQSRNFAADHGCGDKVLEESWRRTWWELYVTDALFAGIRHLPTFTLWQVDADVDIPCEEEQYIEGVIPLPRTLAEYDDRGFDEDDVGFSSYAYLIDTARILGTTLAAGDIANKSAYSLVKSAEANLMSWELHLPRSKRDPVRSDGTIDEILFKAHMVFNT
ncbi:Zn2Cys6 transcriptional regulator [Trichoderma parareesei]|uniref:Zn2Cys6 transcriptional regulator n=1 Tax=Trichoderma parareesei TaxID=858221 RepID=A0A2H2ZW67_TRIPA|nr:Zn2Cys6 transcriptional regulator [Trichoderma parareesei]